MDRRSPWTSCGVCGGPVKLRFPGDAAKPTPEALAPTNHSIGGHGDLYQCGICGSVQQPSLPAGRELEELYRAMGDEAYLAEERGRRATAGRLLDLIQPHIPGGRLLEVGCGHGLLLDEARRRGYEVTGIDLSATAAGYARDVLGLNVQEVSLAEFDGRSETYAAVLMVDVIEHFDDPPAALDRCVELLAPGGVLVVVTPDPGSLTARLAGARWWGYVPAHTYLLPRRTLRELLASRGLVLSTDRTLVRTFSVSYWVSGLAERVPALAALMKAGSTTLHRFASWSPSLSASLGDERVVLAHKTETIVPGKTLASDRGGKTKVHVVLSAHNAAATLPRVAAELPAESFDRALVIDDASSDETAAAALRAGFELIRHPASSGNGANQKTGFVRAALDGADIVVVAPADADHDVKLLAQLVAPIEAGEADVVIGSVADGSLTAHRAYSTEILSSLPFLRNSDGPGFDEELFAQLVSRRARVARISVNGPAETRSPWHRLLVRCRFRIDKQRRRWPLLRPPAVDLLADRDRPRSGSAP